MAINEENSLKSINYCKIMIESLNKTTNIPFTSRRQIVNKYHHFYEQLSSRSKLGSELVKQTSEKANHLKYQTSLFIIEFVIWN